MRRTLQRYHYIIWFVLGLILATIGVNRLFSSGLINYQVLYQSAQQGWQNQIEHTKGSQWWIVGVRLLETGAVWLLCRRTRIYGKPWGLSLLFCLIGIATGFSMILLTWCRGVWGIFCWFASVFPHTLFYIAAWGLMVLQAEHRGAFEHRKFWIVVILFFLGGLLGELWINPIFLRFV